MVYLVAVVVGLAFGGGDQYLGSLVALPWAWAVSGLSAPWLVLPFVFGCTQSHARRAALVGLVATASALVGYFAMTLSPVEGVHLGSNPRLVVGLLQSNVAVVLGGILTGPLYGLLGQGWHVRRRLAERGTRRRGGVLGAARRTRRRPSAGPVGRLGGGGGRGGGDGGVLRRHGPREPAVRLPRWRGASGLGELRPAPARDPTGAEAVAR